MWLQHNLRYCSSILIEVVKKTRDRKQSCSLSVGYSLYLKLQRASYKVRVIILIPECKLDLDSLQCYGWEVINHPDCSLDLMPGDLQLFGTLKKHLVGKQFATGASMMQAVNSCQQIFGTDFSMPGYKSLCHSRTNALISMVTAWSMIWTICCAYTTCSAESE